MAENFITRRFQKKDEEQIVDILKKSFTIWANNKNPLEKWKWKYLETPLGTDIVVSTHENKIIGVTHNLVFNLKLGQSIIRTHFGADSATHPEYRGKGVFGKIIEKIEEIRKENNIQFEYAISTNPAVRKVWANRGRKPFPFKISYMLKVNDIDKHFKNKKMDNSTAIKYLYTSLNAVNKLSKTKKTIKNNPEFIITQIEKFDKTIDIFWESVKDNYHFILEKNRTYLNWRYGDNRAGNYTIFQARKNNEIIGFLVLQVVENNGYEEGFIQEILTIQNRTDVANALLMKANSFFENRKTNAIYYMVVKKHPYQKIAAENGFVDCKQVSFVTCHIIGVEKEFETLHNSNPSQVYFNYGDLF
jgi:GNAT superfamily N-acetyltransferase